MQNKIENLKKKLEEQKQNVSFDLLAKSLASYPFSPKDVFDIFCAKENYNIFPLLDEKQDLALKANELMQKNVQACFLNLQGNEELESLALFRRYSNLALIRYDLIIDEYQVLNSLIYGADGINLKADILDKKLLSSLIELSNQLGISPIIEIKNYSDLKKAIFARADIIFIDENDFDDDKTIIKLLKSTPNNKVIILKVKNYDKERFSFFHQKGIDSFIVEESLL